MAPAPLLAPGDILANRYRIEEVIGKGGFGAVFRATQLNLGRSVALKVLLPTLVDSVGNIDRFRREAELAQQLEHPNTVRLYDFGQHEGMLFLVFELLRGQALDAIIAQAGPSLPDRVARLASQVLKSLMEAHSRGIVHRDIKPSNIFVASFQGEPDFVKVLDFGIAKPVTHRDKNTLTSDGQIIGTPSYMAPEQVTGDKLGPWTDVYSLGLVMAEALTGQVVFTGATSMKVCMDQASPDPVPLPAGVFQSALGEVVHRATQKVPANRYTSAEDMLAALEVAAKSLPQSSHHAPVPAPHQTAGAAAPAQSALAYQGTHGGALAEASAQAPSPVVVDAGELGAPTGAVERKVPARSSSAALVIALLAGGLVVVGTFVFGLIVLGASFDDEDAFGGSATTPSGSGDLAVLTSDDVEERIEEAGFAFAVTPSIRDDPGVRTSVFPVIRNGQTGVVTFYQFRSATDAIATEAEVRRQPGASARQGVNVIHVRIGGSSSESQELLGSIIDG